MQFQHYEAILFLHNFHGYLSVLTCPSTRNNIVPSVMSKNFKIAKRYRQAAEVINTIPVEKFPQLLTRIFQKLHIKGARLFAEEEETQLKSLFGLTDESLGLVLDGCCYTFEQGTFRYS